MESPQYKAFISYSHRDESWARWLQHALEKYRVPKRLVGQKGLLGPIPARLNPVFRDREDLSSAADLSTQIKDELGRSETLVVICSPTAARSPWVNDEIRYFRQLDQGERILALIVDGDPQAKAADAACFPPALLEMPDGSSIEPLAADVRKYADGKHLSLLKIVAGILGIRLDELRRREAQRQLRNRIVYSAASILLAAIIGWLAYSEATTRAAAQVQRSNTEELLGFMLGDLKRLAPIEGLEILAPDDAMQSQLRQQLGLKQLDNDGLQEKALEWRELGIEMQRSGDSTAAMDAFQKSRAAIIELHQREGNTDRALFELGQAEFYIGEVHWYMGNLDATQASWMRYGALTRRLVNADPTNATYVMELSYTLLNLGALEQARPDPDASRSLQLMQSSLQYNQMALVLDPDNEFYRGERATSLAWLADAWLEQCMLGNALDSRQQSVDLRRLLVEANPEQQELENNLAYGLTGLAAVQQQIGLNAEAISNFEEAINILNKAHLSEPGNTVIEWELIYRTGLLARQLQAMNLPDAASPLVDPLFERMASLSNAELAIDHLMTIEAAVFRVDYARLLVDRGELKKGEALLRKTTDELAELVRQKPGFREGLVGLSYAYFEHWKQFGMDAANEVGVLLRDYLADPENVQSCSDARQAARLAIIDGNVDLARRYTDYVLSKGYFEAGFVAFCKEYQLCDLSEVP